METKLLLGDCLERMAEIPDGSVDMVMSDIPYGEVDQKSSGLRKLDRGDADRCDIDLCSLVESMVRICSGSFYVFCGTQQISELVCQFKSHGLTTRVGVWEKTNPSPMNGTRLWVSGLEFCVFARKANATFNESCQKAVWRYPVGRSKIHPTQKPLQLIARLIEASSNPGDTVFDPTFGSGTTGVACVSTSRHFIGIERDPDYFRIAETRITAAQATLASKPQPQPDLFNHE